MVYDVRSNDTTYSYVILSLKLCESTDLEKRIKSATSWAALITTHLKCKYTTKSIQHFVFVKDDETFLGVLRQDKKSSFRHRLTKLNNKIIVQ